MRRPWMWAALSVALAAVPTLAAAQNAGQFTTAAILSTDRRLFGGYITAGEDALGMVAQLRLSFVPNVDFGFQGGLNRVEVGPEDRTTVRMGGDVRFGVMKAAESSPVDVALGAGIGVQTGDRYTVLSLGPSFVASRTFAMAGGSGITPFGGAFLRFSSVDIGSASDSDFDLALRLGLEVGMGPDLAATGELQINDDSGGNVGFATGLNVRF